jgi:hypothetical protein
VKVYLDSPRPDNMSIALALLWLAVGGRGPSSAVVENYLTALLREHSPGIGERYAGTFAELPQPLRDRARRIMPQHHFVIAKMFYSHWAPNDGTVNILLVADAPATRIVAYAWSPWYSSHSASFARLLQEYKPASEDAAREMVGTLALALAATGTFAVSEPRMTDGRIEVDLTWQEKLWRVVRVPFDLKRGFGDVELFNPIGGHVDKPSSSNSRGSRGRGPRVEGLSIVLHRADRTDQPDRPWHHLGSQPCYGSANSERHLWTTIERRARRHERMNVSPSILTVSAFLCASVNLGASVVRTYPPNRCDAQARFGCHALPASSAATTA